MYSKRAKITFSAIAAAICAGAVIGYIAKGEAQPQTVAMEPVEGVRASSVEIQKPRYLLSQYEGKLAVYIIGKKEPELIFDRFLHYLPDVDRLRLEKGIEVSEYSELLRLIEDYTS